MILTRHARAPRVARTWPWFLTGVTTGGEDVRQSMLAGGEAKAKGVEPQAVGPVQVVAAALTAWAATPPAA